MKWSNVIQLIQKTVKIILYDTQYEHDGSYNILITTMYIIHIGILNVCFNVKIVV